MAIGSIGIFWLLFVYPFNMVVMNSMSRYHIAMEAIRRAERFQNMADGVVTELRTLIQQATQYAYDHLQDPPEIADWTWSRPESQA